MKPPPLEFALVTLILVLVALLALNVLSGAQSSVFVAFLPMLVWGVVLVVKGRQSP